MDVTAFTAMARSEFAKGMDAAYAKPYPARVDPFTTRLTSATKVETHTYMSNLPRLALFKGYSPGVRLTNKEYNVPNFTYRAGPITVSKENIDDDQIGGYLTTINGLPARAQKDIDHIMLSHLAAGTTKQCFDGTAMFADSHTFGIGDNLDTFDAAASDGATHKIIAMVCDSPIKPILFQDREPLQGLTTDASEVSAAKLREFEYWSDCRFGLGYGFWWDAIHLTITDTPTVEEIQEKVITQIINRFRTFTLPKGRDTDDALYVHEGWIPGSENLILACNLKLAEIINTAIRSDRVVTTGGQRVNQYQNIATVVPTSALGA